MFVHAAEGAGQVRDAARFGVDATLDQVRWTDIRDRVFGRIDPNSASAHQHRENGENTTVFTGHATFTGDHSLSVTTTAGSEEVTADRIVVAAGARPTVPAEIAHVPHHTSDTIMRIDALPRSLTILGGGVVGTEFAHIFSGLGVEVSIVNRGTNLLRKIDTEICDRFTALAREQWRCHLRQGAGRAEATAPGGALVPPDGPREETRTPLA